MKPFSQACQNNRQPILDQLQIAFEECQRVLEIGSGTGQHAVFFGREMPHLFWQTSDQDYYHPGISLWLDEAGLDNVGYPLSLNVSNNTWPDEPFDGVFSANTCHIMSWAEVEAMFSGVARVLNAGGVFCLYGPFNRNGAFTSEGNAAFHQSLIARDNKMGVRDDRAVIRLARENGFEFDHDIAMPANNRLLIFSKAR